MIFVTPFANYNTNKFNELTPITVCCEIYYSCLVSIYKTAKTSKDESTEKMSTAFTVSFSYFHFLAKAQNARNLYSRRLGTLLYISVKRKMVDF